TPHPVSAGQGRQDPFVSPAPASGIEARDPSGRVCGRSGRLAPSGRLAGVLFTSQANRAESVEAQASQPVRPTAWRGVIPALLSLAGAAKVGGSNRSGGTHRRGIRLLLNDGSVCFGPALRSDATRCRLLRCRFGQVASVCER